MKTDTKRPVRLEELELKSQDFSIDRAKAIYQEHGCVVARGLMVDYVEDLRRDALAVARQSESLLTPDIPTFMGKCRTPDGSVFASRSENNDAEREILVLGLNYLNSAAALRSALDPRVLDLVEAILGPDIELFGHGHSHYKDARGGHAKLLHQDAPYYEHALEGPVAVFIYLIDTNVENSALHVMPGSHRLGVLPHLDTSSDLGLDAAEWPWERSVAVPAKAGDAIVYHLRMVHGSKRNETANARPAFINRYRRTDDYTLVGGASLMAREMSSQVEQIEPYEQRGLVVRGFRKYQPPVRRR